MSKSRDNYRYSQLSTRSGILAEKLRLQRKLKKQEKKLAQSWENIEESWQVVDRIYDVGGKLFSSAVMEGVEFGYKTLCHFLSKKK